MTIEPKLIYKKFEREVWDNGDSVTKIIKYLDPNQYYGFKQFDIYAYNKFRENNLNFVKIRKFDVYEDRCVMEMDKIDGINAREYLKTAPEDKIWNVCIINYFKWIKAFLDFSKNSRQVYFHMDLNPYNVMIKDDVPYIVDPDQFSWGNKTLFITRMQKHYFQFLEYVVYKI